MDDSIVLRCAAITEMAAGTKQRFASIALLATLSGDSGERSTGVVPSAMTLV